MQLKCNSELEQISFYKVRALSSAYSQIWDSAESMKTEIKLASGVQYTAVKNGLEAVGKVSDVSTVDIGQFSMLPSHEVLLRINNRDIYS